MSLVLLFSLNIVFVTALWHMDVQHNLDRLGQKKTRGFLKISPESAYRVSQYVLILTLLAIDTLFIITFVQK